MFPVELPDDAEIRLSKFSEGRQELKIVWESFPIRQHRSGRCTRYLYNVAIHKYLQQKLYDNIMLWSGNTLYIHISNHICKCFQKFVHSAQSIACMYMTQLLTNASHRHIV